MELCGRQGPREALLGALTLAQGGRVSGTWVWGDRDGHAGPQGDLYVVGVASRSNVDPLLFVTGLQAHSGFGIVGG